MEPDSPGPAVGVYEGPRRHTLSQTDLGFALDELEIASARLEDEKAISLSFTDQGGISIESGALKNIVDCLVRALQLTSYRVVKTLPSKMDTLDGMIQECLKKVTEHEEKLEEIQSEPKAVQVSPTAQAGGADAGRRKTTRAPTKPVAAEDSGDSSPERGATSPRSPRHVDPRAKQRAAFDHDDGPAHGPALDPSVLKALDEKLSEVKSALNQSEIQSEANLRDVHHTMAHRFEEVEKKLEKMVTDFDKTQAKMDEETKAEFGSVEKMVKDLTDKDDDIMVLVSQLERTKVGRNEIEELPRQLESVKLRMEQCEAEGRTNASKAERADSLLNGIDELKASCRTLGEDLRTETSALREWLSRTVDEMRRDVQRKAELEETRDATMSLQVDLESLSARLSTVGSALEALKTKADRGDVMMLREAVANLSAERSDNQDKALFSARCLSCNRSYVDYGGADFANQVDLHAEKQQSLVVHQLQKALNDPRDLEKAINVVTVKIGKPGSSTGMDGTQYSTRSAQYGFSLTDTALVSSKGFKKALPAPPNKDRKAQTLGESDYRHPLRKLLGRTTATITSVQEGRNLQPSGSDASLSSVIPAKAQRSLIAGTPVH